MWEPQPPLTHNGWVRPLECGMRWILGEQSNQFATDRVNREQSDGFWSFLLCESETPAAVGFQPICFKFWRRSRNSSFDTMLIFFSVNLRGFCRAKINLGMAFSSLSPNAQTSFCFKLVGRQRNPPRWAIAQDNIYIQKQTYQKSVFSQVSSIPAIGKIVYWKCMISLWFSVWNDVL